MLKLAPVFSDHMVLQRGKEIVIWGETDAERVVVSLSGHETTGNCRDGRFMISLPPMEAGGPYTLSVKTKEDKLSFTDVVLGEVWLAGGQSNMELELQNSYEGRKELKRSERENIRYYQVPKVAYDCEELQEEEKKSGWKRAGEENSGAWSAVGYYFAKEISRKLGVTVGIIGCSWGGTSASAWVSRETLEMNKKISSYIEEYDKIIENQDFDKYVQEREDYIAYQTEFEKKVSHYYETEEHPTWEEAIRRFGENKYPGPMGPYSEFRPCGLYEMMLSKVCPYTLEGFLYYQGEEDDHKPTTYYELLTALISQWRTDWRDDALPFLLVQLPVFQNEGEEDFKNWPFIREAQMRAYQTVRNTGIAVILESGEYGNIHPAKKEVVGRRLALQAFANVYHLIPEREAFGPIYKDSYVEGDAMVLRFSHADGGFVSVGAVKGFEVAGEDKVYYPATHELDGEKIILRSQRVVSPRYARYCWTNFQEIALFGRSGIPLAPFRTSRLDGSKAGG
ncbi:MAG: sialate O-acetylesterase, partial [Lachnospiraceae bacterium]|nr:sialate O-acetylesterase [Lachnospiraceae bacterium]